MQNTQPILGATNLSPAPTAQGKCERLRDLLGVSWPPVSMPGLEPRPLGTQHSSHSPLGLPVDGAQTQPPWRMVSQPPPPLRSRSSRWQVGGWMKVGARREHAWNNMTFRNMNHWHFLFSLAPPLHCTPPSGALWAGGTPGLDMVWGPECALPWGLEPEMREQRWGSGTGAAPSCWVTLGKALHLSGA